MHQELNLPFFHDMETSSHHHNFHWAQQDLPPSKPKQYWLQVFIGPVSNMRHQSESHSVQYDFLQECFVKKNEMYQIRITHSYPDFDMHFRLIHRTCLPNDIATLQSGAADVCLICYRVRLKAWVSNKTLAVPVELWILKKGPFLRVKCYLIHMSGALPLASPTCLHKIAAWVLGADNTQLYVSIPSNLKKAVDTEPGSGCANGLDKTNKLRFNPDKMEIQWVCSSLLLGSGCTLMLGKIALSLSDSLQLGVFINPNFERTVLLNKSRSPSSPACHTRTHLRL